MRSPSATVALSIVAPCFNEAECIEEFCRRALLAGESAVGKDFEVILVDDGSRDKTWEIITKIAARSEHIIGVKLRRNHGHQLASTAGLSVSQGERILLIDADLQDPPELVVEMMAVMNDGAEVVYGKRISRAGETWFKKVTASAFYRLLSKLSAVNIPADTGDFRLMTRRVVNILLSMPERDRFIRGMVSWIGGNQLSLPYERDPRFAGSTKYPLRKMLKFALDAITSFSTVPLRLASWLGAISALVAICLLAYTLLAWITHSTVTGWTSIMAVVTLFSAAQLVCLGVIGEYLGRLINDQKRRPMFMIDLILDANGTRQPMSSIKNEYP